MKKKVINSLLFGSLGILALGSMGAVVLTSCNEKQDNTEGNSNNNDTTLAQDATKKLYNEYKTKVVQTIGNGTMFINSSKKDDVLKVIDDYINQAQQLQNKINSNQQSSVDEKIWIDSVLFQMKSEKASVTTDAYLLGTCVGGNVCSQYNNVIMDYINYLFNNEDLNEWKSSYKSFCVVIDNIQENFNDGITKGVTLSGIMLKLFLSDILQNCYGKNLNNWLKNNTVGTNIDKDNWTKSLGACSYVTDKINQELAEKTDSKINNNDKETILKDAQEADKKIDNFTNFLINKYWPNVKYGWNNGETPDTFVLTIKDKKNTGEVTNTYPVSANEVNTIVGLGLTQADLNTKDIGIGFAPGEDENGSKIGLKIYQNYLLYKNTTLYDKASEVNKLGIDNVSLIKNRMKDVVKFLAAKVGPGQMVWRPNGFTYDENIFDNNGSIQFSQLIKVIGLASLNEKDNSYTVSDEQLKLFFKWVNCDQWFFGRDILNNQVINLDKKINGWGDCDLAQQYYGKNNDKYSEKNPLPNAAAYKALDSYVDKLGSSEISNSNEFGDAGDLYKKYVVDKKGIAPGFTTVNGAQAYAGATFSMDSYQRWQNAVNSKVATIFVKKNNSKVQAPTELTLNVNVITGVGGAAYANGNNFYLDVNPFYGLQKWSLSTLSSHESLPGHNLQMIYAKDNPASPNAPGNLHYTSYAEGWGLFSEWLAVQYGAYGKPIRLDNATDWLDQNKRMQLPSFDILDFNGDNISDLVNIDIVNANKELFSQDNNEFMNGIFETDFDGDSNINSDSLDQGYYNAMQYFGFLNERQLRAMRMTLDTSIHAGGPAIKNGNIDVNNSNNVGTAEKNTGWSLQDEIDYMQANSGLGQGDVTREAQRYLNYVGQATSYLSGEIVIEKLFGEASAAYQAKNNNQLFMDFTNLAETQNNTAPFFNLILRNGNIPLSTLQKFVEEYIIQNIGDIPNLNENQTINN